MLDPNVTYAIKSINRDFNKASRLVKQNQEKIRQIMQDDGFCKCKENDDLEIIVLHKIK